MLDIWGDKLVKGKIEEVGSDDDYVSPAHLKGRILLMVCFIAFLKSLPTHLIRRQVEYYPPIAIGTGENQDSPDSLHSSSSASEEEKEEEEGHMGLWPHRNKNKAAHISDELAELGYYARSMKPQKGWLHQGKCIPQCTPFYLDA
jgi:phosphatidylinositol phospholipase C delta